ncbi:hypothetical protein MASR1M48_16540 [Lactococcus petauri]
MELLSLKKELLTSNQVEFLSRLLNEDKLTTLGRLVYLTEANEYKSGPYTEEELIIVSKALPTTAIGECLVRSGLAKILKNGYFLELAEVKKAESKSKWLPTADDYKFVVDFWNNEISPVIGKPKISAITSERKTYINRMFKQFGPDRDKWLISMKQVLKTDWILGGRITFTFETLFRNSNFLKFYEAAEAMPTEQEAAEKLLNAMPKMQPVFSEDELEGRL